MFRYNLRPIYCTTCFYTTTMTILDELKVITLDENAATVSLTELRAGRAMVLDMWTTKCVKCPAALSKLNDEAEECASSSTAPLFVSCALSQGAGNRELVVDMVEGEYEALTHGTCVHGMCYY